MKLAVTIAQENASENAFVVWRGLQESMRKAAEYGYHGVELALKDAEDVDPRRLTAWLKEYSLEISCITTGQVFSELGLCFTHPDPDIRARTIRAFLGLIELAGDFGGMVNIGRVRGSIPPDKTSGETSALFCDTLGAIHRAARARGVALVLEPVNRYEINFINSVDEGAALLRDYGLDACGLMPDTFHMNIEDDRIGESLIRNGKWVRYIHFADSNRLAPGMGHLDFDEVFSSLKEIGYDGWASVEILPKPSPDMAARQAADFLLPRLREYNRQQAGSR